MFNILKKDFIVSKKQTIILIILSLFTSLIGYNVSDVAYVMYELTTFISVYLIIQTVIGYDEKNKADIIFNSVAVSRSNIVITKYISFIAFTLMMWFAQYIFTNIYRLSQIGTGGRVVNIWDLVISLIFISIYFSIYYPLYIKFGYIKMRMVNLIMFILIMMLPSWISKFLMSDTGNKFREILNNIRGLNYILLFLLCISMVILIISMFISIKIYEKKDF